MSGSGTFDSHHPKWSLETSHTLLTRGGAWGKGNWGKKGRICGGKKLNLCERKHSVNGSDCKWQLLNDEHLFGRTSLPVHWSFLQIGQAWKQEKQQDKATISYPWRHFILYENSKKPASIMPVSHVSSPLKCITYLTGKCWINLVQWFRMPSTFQL